MGTQYQKRHGMYNTREYGVWEAIIQRCTNPKDKKYADYGGRGITICDRWRDFVNFHADMGERPSPEYSVDRKDNDGPYSPENCRWATRTEQLSNTRMNRFLTFNGETHTISEWARRIGMGVGTLQTRITRYGWPVERALTTPATHSNSRITTGLCRNGHPRTPDNLYTHPSGRQICLTCIRAARRRYKDKHR